MDGDNFKAFMTNSICIFCENMDKLKVNKMTKKEWMEHFLAWSEWGTDVQQWYWN